MATRAELKALRDMAKQRHRAATRKIKRNEQNKGVRLAGSQFDPRRDTSKIDNYTEKQLRSYMKTLDTFTARSMQFVPGASREPIPVQEWRKYKRAEAAFNRKAEQKFDEYRDIFMPFRGMTIGQSIDATTPTSRPGMYDPTVTLPTKHISRSSRSITGYESLQKVMKNIQKRLEPGYFDKEFKRARREYNQMMDVINNPGLKKLVNGLSDEQFAVLWNYTGFADDLSVNYEISMATVEMPYHKTVREDTLRDAVEKAKWAKSVAPNGRLRNNRKRR